MSLVKDLVNGIIWGWGKKITIKDEDASIHRNVRKINFLGVDVLSQVDGIDPTQVNVYIPAAAYPPYYMAGAAAVPDAATTSRHVSGPTAEGVPFKKGGWAAGQMVACTRVGSLAYYTPQVCRFDDDVSTTIEVNVYDANGVAVLANHLTGVIAGNTDVTVNNIRIRTTAWSVIGPIFQANILVDINMAAILPAGGRFSIEIIHHQGADFTKTQGPIFRDCEPDAQTISGTTIASNTVSSAMYLSGIRYYDLGDTFDVGIADIDYLNADSYPTNFVSVNASTYYGIPAYFLTGAQLTGWSTIHNNVDSSYAGTVAISMASFRYIGCAANMTAQVIDWSAGASASSANECICVDTWNPQSDPLSEYFTDEVYRRTSANVLWDSTQDMTAYDDNMGLMIQAGKLQTRWGDWTGYEPGLGGNPDYTGFAGWGTYYRRFIDVTNLTRGSCTLSIAGFTLQNLIDEDVKMWIMVPGRFVSPCYVHGAATYDFGTFDGDNDPIRVLSSTANSIDITFGVLGLTPANNYFIIHIEIQDPTILPDSIVCSW